VNADPPLDDDHAFSWRRAPVQLADRLGVRPAGLLGAVVAVLAAGLGGWWALRPPPPPVEDTLPQAAAMSTAPTPPPSVPGVLVVHVDGAVAQPGVHEVVAGARVIDAVQAAGGLGPSADRTRINLAQPLADGQRVWVPAVGEEVPSVVTADGAPSPTGTARASDPMSLSSAPATALETLPGIGPSLASAIIEHREREGPFARVDDLLEVSGIGPAKLDAIRDLVVP